MFYLKYDMLIYIYSLILVYRWYFVILCNERERERKIVLDW